MSRLSSLGPVALGKLSDRLLVALQVFPLEASAREDERCDLPVKNIHVLVRRALQIRLVKQLLDAQEKLLERDGGLPSRVEQGEANIARGEDVGMGDWRRKLTCKRENNDAKSGGIYIWEQCLDKFR